MNKFERDKHKQHKDYIQRKYTFFYQIHELYVQPQQLVLQLANRHLCLIKTIAKV